jgi:hypothetical protein
MVSCPAGVCLISHRIRPANCTAGQQTGTQKRVAILIERMLNAETEEKAFSDFEALGCNLVRATILRMNTGRSLHEPHLSLLNQCPQTFEGIGHDEFDLYPHF